MERNSDLLRQFESFYNTVEKVKSLFSQELKAKLNVAAIRTANRKKISESYSTVEKLEAMLADHAKLSEGARAQAEAASRTEHTYYKSTTQTVEVR